MGRTARVSAHVCWTPVTNTKMTITTVIVTVASRTHHGCVVSERLCEVGEGDSPHNGNSEAGGVKKRARIREQSLSAEPNPRGPDPESLLLPRPRHVVQGLG